MKIKTVELTVGLFMIAGIVSLLMLAVQVSGLSNILKTESGYKVTVEFANIGGLKVRAKVSLGGVVVGRVVSIALEPKTFNASVVMTIDPARVGSLPNDTRASILTAGLLGDSYIGLTPGFNDTEFLKAGDVIPVENTDSAIILENLVSKFLAGKVSNGGDSKDSKPSPPSEPAIPVHGNKP